MNQDHNDFTTPTPVYSKETDQQRARLSHLDAKLFELRDQLQKPGLTGTERIELTDVLVRLEAEHIAVKEGTVATATPTQQLDDRAEVVKEAERLEATGDPADAEIAKNIRAACNQVDVQDDLVTKQNAKSVKNADKARADNEANALAAQKVYNDELQAAKDADLLKAG